MAEAVSPDEILGAHAHHPHAPDAVETELRAAGRHDFQQNYAEYTPDLAGVALPISGHSRLVVGLVSRCLDRWRDTAVVLARQSAVLPASGG